MRTKHLLPILSIAIICFIFACSKNETQNDSLTGEQDKVNFSAKNNGNSGNGNNGNGNGNQGNHPDCNLDETCSGFLTAWLNNNQNIINDFTYADLMSYPYNKSLRIYSILPPISKARIWSEKLQIEIDRGRVDNFYNSEQLIAIADLKRLISENLFKPENINTSRTRINAWKSSIDVYFPNRDAARTIFHTFEIMAQQAIPPRPPFVVYCECSSESDYCRNGCLGGIACDQNNPNNWHGLTGCGTLKLYTCDGICGS